jgi:hypothetical protein
VSEIPSGTFSKEMHEHERTDPGSVELTAWIKFIRKDPLSLSVVANGMKPLFEDLRVETLDSAYWIVREQSADLSRVLVVIKREITLKT